MKKIIISTLAASFIAGSAFAGVEGVTAATPFGSDADNSGFIDIVDEITSDITLDSVATGVDYCLGNIVYVVTPDDMDPAVEDPTVLKINAGTIIRGVQGENGVDGEGNPIVVTEPGTLVITRGAQIEALGTKSAPIVFTYKDDNANPIVDPTPPLINGNLITGLWGGVIILGNAPCNNDQSADNALLVPGTDFIEGIAEPDPLAADPDLRGIFGGQDIHDNSGIMQFVSIRHGGFELGAANEINGLTMGGVGAGTVIENIEVIAGQDDGFEWFGGTVNSKFLLSAYNNDDAFDYDQGFSGLGQFWAVVQADNQNDGDKGGEFDGDDQFNAIPFATPVIYNMTVIGTGDDGVASGNGGGQVDYDNGAGGSLFNSIIVESGVPSLDVNVDKLDTSVVPNVVVPNTGTLIDLGLLRVRSNIWHRDVANTSDEAVADHDAGRADELLTPAVNLNTFGNPFIGGANFAVMATADRDSVNGVYLVPSAFGAVVNDLEPYNIGTFFTGTNYKGAFEPGASTWTSDWTVGSVLGYFAE